MNEHDQGHPQRPEGSALGPLGVALRNRALARRSFVALGLIAIAGCAARTAQQTLRAPEPMWPNVPPEPPAPANQTPAVAHGSSGVGGSTAGAGARTAPAAGAELASGPVPFALSRQSWARGPAVVKKIDPMLPPRWITVHHDGMKPFQTDDEAETKARLESIRNSHLQRDDGWGDIGYHFIVDRAGRVWEGRSLRYQGAHVKWCNENNIGVMCLGNFEEQQPSAAQIAGLERVLVALRTYYRIPVARVRTHREWPTARTQCPGASLQARMVVIRRNGAAA
ncbi:MAG: N-acetylmuramoyl-L-alanine amidase [Phycisphaerae bacterium]|nr:N-acetylmuramoyl-L-alanine amidase [Phycisphaerae bacterium]